MKLGYLLAAGLVAFAWLFVLIGMGTLSWISGTVDNATTVGVVKTEVNIGLLRQCSKTGSQKQCDTLKSNGKCGGIKHSGGWAFSMLLFAIAPGLVALVVCGLAGVEMEVGPLDSERSNMIAFVSTTLFQGLVFLAWFGYVCGAYSNTCYKDTKGYKAGYSFALVITAWFIFLLPSNALTAAYFFGIAIPVLVDPEKSTASV